jgi:hypothetical protein
MMMVLKVDLPVAVTVNTAPLTDTELLVVPDQVLVAPPLRKNVYVVGVATTVTS